jgi:phosphoribosylanthranilate isomerase
MGYHLRVKICGVTHPADLAVAAEAGADAIGFNFHPASPRSVTPDQARALIESLPPFVEPVGVFVQKCADDVAPFLGQLPRLRTIQLHGGGYGTKDCFPYRFIPAFQIRDPVDLESVTGYLESCRLCGWTPAAVLLDGHAPGLTGGTGQTAPWELLAGFRPGVPVLLAGGLTPDNVGEAVRIVRPYAVDVASGVESSPGRKNPDKVRRFIERARDAARSS